MSKKVNESTDIPLEDIFKIIYNFTSSYGASWSPIVLITCLYGYYIQDVFISDSKGFVKAKGNRSKPWFLAVGAIPVGLVMVVINWIKYKEMMFSLDHLTQLAPTSMVYLSAILGVATLIKYLKS